MNQFVFEMMCDDINNKYSNEQLREMAARIGIPNVQDKTKRQLCKAMSIWASDMKHNSEYQRSECSVADSNIMGDELSDVPPYFIYKIATNLTFERDGEYVQNANVCSDIRDLIEWIGEYNLPNEQDPANKALEDLVGKDRHPQYSGIILSLALKRDIRARWAYLKSILTPETLNYDNSDTNGIDASYERPSWIQPLEDMLQAMPYVRYNASQMGLLPDWKLISIVREASGYEITQINDLDVVNFEARPTISHFVSLMSRKLEACAEPNKLTFIVALNQAIDQDYSRAPNSRSNHTLLLGQRFTDFLSRRPYMDRETELKGWEDLFKSIRRVPEWDIYHWNIFHRILLDPIMSNDQDVMKIIMTYYPHLIVDAPDSVKNNEMIMEICVMKDKTLFQYASLRLRHNFEFVKKCSRMGVSWDRYLDMVRQDDVLGRILMRIDAFMIYYVSDRLKNDDSFIIHLIQTNVMNANNLLHRLNDRQRDNFEIAAISVINSSFYGSFWNLRDVSDRLKNDKTFMKLVAKSSKNDDLLMNQMGSSLKDDANFMSSLFDHVDAVTVYNNASERLRNDPEFEALAFRQNLIKRTRD